MRQTRAAAPRPLDSTRRVADQADAPAHPQTASPSSALPSSSHRPGSRPLSARPSTPLPLSAHPLGSRPPRFDDLRRTAQARMVRLAWLLLGSRPEAEDVVDAALTELRGRWSRVDDPGRELLGAVLRGALAPRRPRRADDRTGPAFPGELDLPDEPGATGDPGVDAVWAAVAGLRPDRRATVVLRYWAGLDVQGIAVAMGCPVPAVRTRLRRALREVEDAVAVGVDDHGDGGLARHETLV